MIAYGIVHAALLILACWVGKRMVRRHTILERRYKACKQDVKDLSFFSRPQYDNIARVIKDCDYANGVYFYLVYMRCDESGAVLRLRRFDYVQNDKDDEDYARNCAEELCDYLNSDYRINK